MLRATQLHPSAGPSHQTVRVSDLRGANIWFEAEQLHVLWPAASEKHQIVADASVRSHDIDAVVLPLDENFETRLDAARGLWRALKGRPPGELYGKLPGQTKLRHILNLRAHDGRRDGATNRLIAERLLSREPIAPRDWRDHHLRHRVRAILRRTDRLVAGGYRDLLFYPQSRGRKSGR